MPRSSASPINGATGSTAPASTGCWRDGRKPSLSIASPARLFPDDYATHYNLGLALLKLDQHAEAVAALERAVALAPDQHDFLITLGTAYVGAGQTQQARTAFERFLTAAPSAPDAAKVRAMLSSMDAGSQ